MADASRPRGAQPLSERDWVFGSRPRRRLLETVLLRRAPQQGWTRPQLAQWAGVMANGGVDEHLQGLQRLGLLVAGEGRPGVWHPVRPRPELGRAIRRVLVVLDAASDELPAPGGGGVTGSAMRAAAAVRAAERFVWAARDELGAEAVDELLRLLGDVRQRVEAGGG